MRNRTGKAIWIWIALFAFGCFVCGNVFAAEVSQGKCAQYNKEAKTISIEEYNITFTKANPYGEPTGATEVYNVSTALIGITPEPGDVLRIAYEVKGTERIALKVMNVSKQNLMKK